VQPDTRPATTAVATCRPVPRRAELDTLRRAAGASGAAVLTLQALLPEPVAELVGGRSQNWLPCWTTGRIRLYAATSSVASARSASLHSIRLPPTPSTPAIATWKRKRSGTSRPVREWGESVTQAAIVRAG